MGDRLPDRCMHSPSCASCLMPDEFVGLWWNSFCIPMGYVSYSFRFFLWKCHIAIENNSTIDNRVLQIGIHSELGVSFVNHFALGLRIYQDGAPPPKKQTKRGVVVVTLVLLLVHNPTANGFYPTSTFYWCTSTSTCLLLGDSTREKGNVANREKQRVFGVSVDIYFSSLLFSIFEGGRINHFHTSCRTRLDHSLHIYITIVLSYIDQSTRLEILDSGVYRKGVCIVVCCGGSDTTATRTTITSVRRFQQQVTWSVLLFVQEFSYTIQSFYHQ